MPFMDLIKRAIFEEEPLAPQTAKPPPAPSTGRSAQPASAYAPMPSRDHPFYARLAKQTDLSAVPELAKIEQYAAPLASVITDKSLRYKAALATAQSQGGLTNFHIGVAVLSYAGRSHPPENVPAILAVFVVSCTSRFYSRIFLEFC